MATLNTSRAQRVQRRPAAPGRSQPARLPSRSESDDIIRRARQERRRRERHFARRRRDLIQDALLGLVLALVVLSVTAGLAVVALMELLVGLAVGTFLAGRRVHRWRARRRG